MLSEYTWGYEKISWLLFIFSFYPPLCSAKKQFNFQKKSTVFFSNSGGQRLALLSVQNILKDKEGSFITFQYQSDNTCARRI